MTRTRALMLSILCLSAAACVSGCGGSNTKVEARTTTVGQELQDLEQRFPELQKADSPTQTVGGARSDMFEPVEHLERMMSLDNAFGLGEFDAWVARVERDLGEVPPMLCELKIDGLAVDLVYRHGRLASLATRGDGRVGEDVTYNARFIPGIPKQLSGAPDLVEVRGEVYFPVAEFAALNEQQLELGRSPFANPRNAGAGTLRQRVDRRQAEILEAEDLEGDGAEGRADGKAVSTRTEPRVAVQIEAPISGYSLLELLRRPGVTYERLLELRSELLTRRTWNRASPWRRASAHARFM